MKCSMSLMVQPQGLVEVPSLGETEVMRIACFYPPLNIRVQKQGSAVDDITYVVSRLAVVVGEYL